MEKLPFSRLLSRLRTSLVLLLVVLVQFHATAKEGPEKRVALVIGNAAYKESPLANPVNDAEDMSNALKAAGFEVIQLTNATQKQMHRAISKFGEQLSSDSVALFYYAGHGVQVRGKNYLIPVDAEISGENSIRVESVDVDAVLEQLSSSELNVVILDACRNNPYERRFRSISGGLAQMEAPKGSLIAYATGPGKTAMDGVGRNGLYTRELLKQLRQPNLVLEAVFKNVRRNVARATRDQQIPWETSSLTGDFYFSQNKAEAAAAAAPPQAKSAAPKNPAVVDKPESKTAEKIPAPQTAPTQAIAAAAVTEKGNPTAKDSASPSSPDAGVSSSPSRPAAVAALQEPSRQNTPRREATPASAPEDGSSSASLRAEAKARESAPSAAAATPPPKTVKATAEPASSSNARPALAGAGEEGVQDASRSPTAAESAASSSLSPDSASQPLVSKSRDAGQEVAQKAAAVADSAASPEMRDLVAAKAAEAQPVAETQVAIATPLPKIDEAPLANGEKRPLPETAPALKVPEVSPAGNNDSSPAPVTEKTLQLKEQKAVGNFSPDPKTGLLSGTGKIVWSNGDRFEGTLRKGLKEGKGKFIWADGQQYDGEWQNNKANGKGVLVFANGVRYEGMLKDDLPNGKGSITFSNGDRFEGNFVAGQPNGDGVMHFAAGGSFEGQVKDGFPHGAGTYRYRNGDTHTGSWVNGKQHGPGRYTWANGSYWEGEFVDGSRGTEKSSFTVVTPIGDKAGKPAPSTSTAGQNIKQPTK